MSCATGSTVHRRLRPRALPRGVERRRQRQQFVDRRRLVLLFGEAVAFGERPDLVGADPIDEPVEMLANPRFGSAAVGRLEQDVDGAIEFLTRGIDVPELELALAGLEVAIGFGDERDDGIGGRRGAARPPAEVPPRATVTPGAM